MRVNQSLILSKSKHLSAILLAGMISYANTNDAYALTGEEILTNLDTEAQFHYVSGAIGGIAYSRFVRDKPSQDGMKCMLDWWNKPDDTTAWQTVKQWLEHHKEKTAETVLYAVLSKECGK